MIALASPPAIGTRVKVAQQLEEDRLAVGRDVERDPRPFVGRELDRPVGLERQALDFFFLGSSFFAVSFDSCFALSLASWARANRQHHQVTARESLIARRSRSQARRTNRT